MANLRQRLPKSERKAADPTCAKPLDADSHRAAYMAERIRDVFLHASVWMKTDGDDDDDEAQHAALPTRSS